jgi:hypothetical protein
MNSNAAIVSEWKIPAVTARGKKKAKTSEKPRRQKNQDVRKSIGRPAQIAPGGRMNN